MRSIGLQILKQEILEASDEVHWATDNGSGEFHGNMVDLMRSLHHDRPGFVHVIGPIPLMRAAAELTDQLELRNRAYADEEKRASSGDFTQGRAVFMDKCAIQRT